MDNSDKNGPQPTADGSLPVRVYGDAVAPSARVVGRTLEGLVRSALRPIDGVVWGLDRVMDWVARRVTAKLETKALDSTQLTAPPVEVEGRVLLALQTAGPSEEPYLRNMFASLLATSMDVSESRSVHPSFPNILNQLSSIDAKVLALVSAQHHAVQYVEANIGWFADASGDLLYTFNPDTDWPHTSEAWHLIGDLLGISVNQVQFAISNLTRHQLLDIATVEGMEQLDAKINAQDVRKAFDECGRLLQYYTTVPKPTWNAASHGFDIRMQTEIRTTVLTPTFWGWYFVNATSASEFFDVETRRFRLPGWAA